MSRESEQRPGSEETIKLLICVDGEYEFACESPVTMLISDFMKKLEVDMREFFEADRRMGIFRIQTSTRADIPCGYKLGDVFDPGDVVFPLRRVSELIEVDQSPFESDYSSSSSSTSQTLSSSSSSLSPCLSGRRKVAKLTPLYLHLIKKINLRELDEKLGLCTGAEKPNVQDTGSDSSMKQWGDGDEFLSRILPGARVPATPSRGNELDPKVIRQIFTSGPNTKATSKAEDKELDSATQTVGTPVRDDTPVKESRCYEYRLGMDEPYEEVNNPARRIERFCSPSTPGAKCDMELVRHFVKCSSEPIDELSASQESASTTSEGSRTYNAVADTNTNTNINTSIITPTKLENTQQFTPPSLVIPTYQEHAPKDTAGLDTGPETKKIPCLELSKSRNRTAPETSSTTRRSLQSDKAALSEAIATSKLQVLSVIPKAGAVNNTSCPDKPSTTGSGTSRSSHCVPYCKPLASFKCFDKRCDKCNAVVAFAPTPASVLDCTPLCIANARKQKSKGCEFCSICMGRRRKEAYDPEMRHQCKECLRPWMILNDNGICRTCHSRDHKTNGIFKPININQRSTNSIR